MRWLAFMIGSGMGMGLAYATMPQSDDPLMNYIAMLLTAIWVGLLTVCAACDHE